METQAKVPRTRTIGFRLTETEYEQLVTLAQQKQRRTADLVRLIVVNAIKRSVSTQPQVTANVEDGQ
jgi:hypothetical protein